MSGTSMDGVDLSVIKSDGFSEVEQLYDKYFEFDDNLLEELIILRENLKKSDDLKKYLKKIKEIERKFTLFNSKIVNKVKSETGIKIDLIGFHGQTILHLPKEKISKQLGDGSLLSQLSKCSVVNSFRQKDLDNNGQGAPLAPIFHNLITKNFYDNFNLKYPIVIINIGGITNVTQIINIGGLEKNIFAYDIAPGNCLIDEWLRKNSNKKYDENGEIANSGRVNDQILNQAIENFEINSIKESLDIKNFDLSFVKGLTLEDGCATLTKFTAYLISEGLKKVDQENKLQTQNYIMCGGGRKNITLIKNINQFISREKLSLKNIDQYQIDGDFVESQAFAYLAIRSFLDLPISFPNTTRCNKPISGGKIINNF
jgi:anhydro-N-acetylmuramic acid kinase